jgi:hypothetical protein
MASADPGAAAASAVVRATHALEGVSAASGLEIAPDGAVYVPGDDSVFLYHLDLSPPGPPRVRRRLRLAASRDVDAATGAVRSEEGIPKKLKPDFEAIVALPRAGAAAPATAAAPRPPPPHGAVLAAEAVMTPAGAPAPGAAAAAAVTAAAAGAYDIAVFGSASKAGLRDGIVLIDPSAPNAAPREFEAAGLMGALRADARVTGSAKLNLEAAALVGDNTLALFNR